MNIFITRGLVTTDLPALVRPRREDGRSSLRAAGTGGRGRGDRRAGVGGRRRSGGAGWSAGRGRAAGCCRCTGRARCAGAGRSGGAAGAGGCLRHRGRDRHELLLHGKPEDAVRHVPVQQDRAVRRRVSLGSRQRRDHTLRAERQWVASHRVDGRCVSPRDRQLVTYGLRRLRDRQLEPRHCESSEGGP
jgi:hypothetical protein